MKKLIYILLALLIAGATAYKLTSNKEKLAAKAAVSQIKSQAISVQLTEPKVGKIDKSFTAQGNFAPMNSLTLLSETSGQVQKVLKRKGDKVRAGEVLVQVEANTMSADLATAQANFEKAKRDLGRFENLAAGEAITKRQLEEARLNVKVTEAQLVAARQRVNKTRITAPISGEINEIYIEVGSFLSMGTKLYDIVNVDKLKLKIQVDESQVLLIDKGDKVNVKADVNAAQTYEGTVTAIAAQATNALKYDVEVEVKNPEKNSLRAGMYGTASFQIAEQRDALLLPRESIVGGIQDPSVYVVENGIAKLKKVKAGTVTQDQVEIVEGVNAGEKVVRSGQINLVNGAKVQAI
ncbi:efflux RND transporter periplasmic adaptor subunit [Adhaeribacter soli]|uniref:Efflux RND transporter periplasmic adaptor subunit n=1 Tax=Adhaeribacter soli TaxID=2607655 RepID=A0A5N1J328_9BACT|nr:efflux RND transporter periplasmic adaptor subunit [Adhaeribacter soli]KAA9339042.1 efflux RND transporter periplasmic adaptor subunit [Adhaeribacter soli]